MSQCLFCKIAQKEISAQIIYEDDCIVSFLDIHPVMPGHLLVVPKQHFEGIQDADPETLGALMCGVQKLANALLLATGSTGFNVFQNNGISAGQAISHLHFHIIPRNMNDGLHHWPGSTYHEGEADVLADTIIKNLIA